jgi:hypothetical protein
MIVVKIEFWKWGFDDLVTEIGRMYIWNKGGTHDRGDYGVAVMEEGKFELDPKVRVEDQTHICRKAEVMNYPRLSYNVWRLITRALRGAFPEEK